MSFFYKPIFDDQGQRIPRYALEGGEGEGSLEGMGQVVGAEPIEATLRNLSDQAIEVADIVRGTGRQIDMSTATASDVDRARLAVINFSRDVGRNINLVPADYKARIDAARRKLLADMMRLQGLWSTRQADASGVATQIRNGLATMATDLEKSARKAGRLVAEATEAVASGASSVAGAAANGAAGFLAKTGLVPILVAGAVIAGLGVYAMHKPARATR